MTSEERFDKARRSIEAARLLLSTGDVDFAAARAYYAMFYTAEALLSAKGLQYGKHSAVQAAYGVHFAKTRVLDPLFHRWLLEAYAARIEGDYGVGADLEGAEVGNMIDQAELFLAAARAHLEGQG